MEARKNQVLHLTGAVEAIKAEKHELMNVYAHAPFATEERAQVMKSMLALNARRRVLERWISQVTKEGA